MSDNSLIIPTIVIKISTILLFRKGEEYKIKAFVNAVSITPIL